MGATNSTTSLLVSLAEMDYENYEGERFSKEIPDSADNNCGPIHFSAKTPLDPTQCTLYHNFQQGLAMENGSLNCFGTRRIDSDGQVGPYEWLTYAQVAQRIDIVASGIHKLCGLKRQGIVGVFSKNRLEWCLVEHACNRMAYILVPLYDTLGPDAVPYVVNHTEMRVLFFAKDQFESVMRCKDQCETLKIMIQFEDVSDAQRQQAANKNVIIKSLSELEAVGVAHRVEPDIPTAQDICTICYTSGTTGTPKGVVLTQGNTVSNAYCGKMLLPFTKDDVHLSFLPLPHIFERSMHSMLLNQGGSIGFYQGDIKLLLDDVQELQPTIFTCVPRLLNRIYDKVMQDVDKSASMVAKALFHHALTTKLAAIEDGSWTHTALWDSLVFNKIRNELGGRVRLILSGSAPLRPDVKQFFHVAFNCVMLEGYGMTETGGVTTVAKSTMPFGFHCGIPNVNLEVRLRDVPEMNYTNQDKPRPRGEILVRGDSVFVGYYKQPELTRQVLDQDGWFATGDIGCWNADGTISILDRKKNLFKLSQGEYIAPEKIEGVYLKSPFIAQIFVYGDSFKDTLVAVVVPDPETAKRWAHENNQHESSSLESLCDDLTFKEAVAESMLEMGKQNGLCGFEKVKAFHLVAQAFALEQGLVTPTFKLQRVQLKKYFQKEIDRMYSQQMPQVQVQP